jgi:hypothetical protein
MEAYMESIVLKRNSISTFRSKSAVSFQAFDLLTPVLV